MKKVGSATKKHILRAFVLALFLSLAYSGLQAETQVSALFTEALIARMDAHTPMRTEAIGTQRQTDTEITDEHGGVRVFRLVAGNKKHVSKSVKRLAETEGVLQCAHRHLAGFGALAMLPYRVHAKAGSDIIISYMHDQDGQKDSLLLS